MGSKAGAQTGVFSTQETLLMLSWVLLATALPSCPQGTLVCTDNAVAVQQGARSSKP